MYVQPMKLDYCIFIEFPLTLRQHMDPLLLMLHPAGMLNIGMTTRLLLLKELIYQAQKVIQPIEYLCFILFFCVP